MKNLEPRLQRLEQERTVEDDGPKEILICFVAPDENKTVVSTQRIVLV